MLNAKVFPLAVGVRLLRFCLGGLCLLLQLDENKIDFSVKQACLNIFWEGLF
jgi:hypothetical protein